MIYLKYSSRHDPSNWAIYSHHEGNFEEQLEIHAGHVDWALESYTFEKGSYIIQEVSEEEVDLLKLGRL